MIDPVLRKFGLSENRRAVKNGSEKQSETSRFHTPHKTKYLQSNCNHKNHSAGGEKAKSKLEVMIEYLQSNSMRKCGQSGHEHNRVKYVCLNEGCANNFGCSHCFLYQHGNHLKAQIDICIRDLQQINNLSMKSYDQIYTERTLLRREVIKQIDSEITNLCNEFHANLQFLKNKALKQVDDFIFHNYQVMALMEVLQLPSSAQKEQSLLNELLRIDIKMMERDLYDQIKNAKADRLNVLPVIKLFQEMNGAMTHFMAEFKKCFPKLHRVEDWQPSDYYVSEFKPSEEKTKKEPDLDTQYFQRN